MTPAVLNNVALPLFIRLQEQGFDFQVADGSLFIKPVARVTPELRAKLRQHKPALVTLVGACDQGVQDRVAVYRDQRAAVTATIGPFLFRPNLPYDAGVCFSCGDRLPEARFGRCWRCALAWRLAWGRSVAGEVAAAHDVARVCA